MAYKGKFVPKFPDKYKGDVKNIVYRSLWERRVMRFLDDNPNILLWGSEEVKIPYLLLENDGRMHMHNYYPDFIVKLLTKDGKETTLIMEIKPAAQSTKPKVPDHQQIASPKRKRRFLKEMRVWKVNSAKWEAAREYCLDKGWQFVVLTEKDLGLK